MSDPRHRRPRLGSLAWGALAGLLLAAAIVPNALAAAAALAEASAAQKREALQHFVAGKRAAKGKKWERAVSELRASLEIVNSPNARLVLSRALRDSGLLGDAWEEYGRTAADASKLAGREPQYTQTASAAVKERGEIEGRLAFLTVSLVNAPDGAALIVGGRAIPPEQWGAPISVAPGTVDVVVTDASGQEIARQTVGAAVGGKKFVSLDAKGHTETLAGAPVAPAPGAAPAATTPAAPPVVPPAALPASAPASAESSSVDATADAAAHPGDRTGLRPYAYVAGRVGAAGLLAFGILGAMDHSTYSDLQGACHPGCPADKQGEISTGRTEQTLANVGLVVGIMGVAAGATLFVLSIPPKMTPGGDAALVVTPGYVGLRGSL
jgi:hypothetical protein